VLQANTRSVQVITSSTLTHYTSVTRMTNTTHNSSQHYILHTLLQESHFHFAYSNLVDKLCSSTYNKMYMYSKYIQYFNLASFIIPLSLTELKHCVQIIDFWVVQHVGR
jgi:hypothetical protein